MYMLGERGMARIVSLIPSATEIVCALGCEGELIGRSHECDFPVSVQGLPVCTAPKFNPEGTSRDIDQRVKALLTDTVSVYQINREQLKALSPDVILTQAQCEVCAVSFREVEAVVREITESPCTLVSLSPNRLEDVWHDVKKVATVLGVVHRGESLVEGIQRRIDSIATTATVETTRPTVGCIEWLDPLMASANWMPELVSLAGGCNVFGRPGQQASWIEWDLIREQDPDILLLLPCGFSIARTLGEISILTKKPGWSDLKAVNTSRVFLADGNHYFNRSGPRLMDSLEILAEIFHPTRFQFGYGGKGWVRWTGLSCRVCLFSPSERALSKGLDSLVVSSCLAI